MDFDKYILWQMEQDSKLRDEVGHTYFQAQLNNLNKLRDLVVHMTTISAGIIGFTIPVFGSSTLVKTPALLIGGLLELLVLTTYGIWYLKWILETENRDLTLQHRKYNEVVDSIRDSHLKTFENPTEKSFQHQQEVGEEVMKALIADPVKDKRDYALDILFIAFTLGLLLIILSLVPVKVG
ncbi:hypothetical protein C4561_00775 [candidate division WWE3 bacterium]|jgi:hypothetical protein|uniref:Uncharacterized protein n=1 Tax=candidate division WWE3 bacterium TaxID=2053526 RepID=A0A3A4ZFT9_UNCKA|nr:MAG: hypothetical protein C4561_00775 [candidate division WWE3 bacterium]